MGQRGFVAKPTVIKAMEGFPGHHPKPSRLEPKPREGEPRMPRELSTGARKHWRRMAPLLVDLGLLTEIDGDMFGSLCEKMTESEEFAKNIRKTGYLIKTRHGNVVTNPLVKLKMSVDAEILQRMRDFGMSPSARSRIQVEPRDKSDGLEAMCS